MSRPGGPGAAQWNSRFSVQEYVYGTKPNDFLVESVPALPPAPARVLSLGEGEGRNAVYLASLGHRVTAVDASDVGLRKAERLALRFSVTTFPESRCCECYQVVKTEFDRMLPYVAR